MEHNMILSASGWRKVFVESGDQHDTSENIGNTNSCLSVLIAESFINYLQDKCHKKRPVIVVGRDTRPTGIKIAEAVLKTMLYYKIKVEYLGVTAAPEIMAYSKTADGFLYISASHNPVGHNGIKFGLNDGGVLEASQSKILADDFKAKLLTVNCQTHAESILKAAGEKEYSKLLTKGRDYKIKALDYYENFIKEVITGSNKKSEEEDFFNLLAECTAQNPLSIVCDMNGSARCRSIDERFIKSCKLNFIAMNNTPGEIAHEIIPEPENLVWCAGKMNELHQAGDNTVLLGYMPDCDGDRGNMVYWDEKKEKAFPIEAQTVFALCVMAELAFEYWKNPKAKKLAVAVNCPTSMRIEEICKVFKAEVFRGEVGEANIVNLAREKRAEGYNVRILGEGSNGGNITYPSCVRDPVATVFAAVKLLSIRDTLDKKGKVHEGIFHLWCRLSGNEDRYKQDFTLSDILETLPEYVTTGVSESRAVLDVKTEDKGHLKLRFQKIFMQEWEERKAELLEKYGIADYECITTNGTKEVRNASDWNNGNGGLKVLFKNQNGTSLAYIWMRPSGTEKVFRVLCDVKGKKPQMSASLLDWERAMLTKADSLKA
ncbi:phosphoglucomutase [Treponema sp.]|uniref:phosphoglucomutase n=1 Tax=Treponema sp. TaxID=166 RepID=UPI0025E362C8|nr:phosphoglucomutase [Treponema sp.]